MFDLVASDIGLALVWAVGMLAVADEYGDCNGFCCPIDCGGTGSDGCGDHDRGMGGDATAVIGKVVSEVIGGCGKFGWGNDGETLDAISV